MTKLRKCYAVSYYDSNTGIEFGSYLLAIDKDDLKVQVDKYVNNPIITDIVPGAEGHFITGYDCVIARPIYEFESMQNNPNETQCAKYVKKLAHTVVFLISRINDKGLPTAHFLSDNGLLHEIIHVISGTTDVFYFFQNEIMKRQLLEIERLLPELFLTDEELDLVKQIKGIVKCPT